jgi:predicted ATPase
MQDIETCSAVQLFVKSAGRVRPGFELTSDNLAGVIDICRLVDGMPLGIELAAAWVELLSPAEIVTEIQNSLDFLETTLRDFPSRQRSIRSIFESTWNRLTDTEQEVFQQLSIFRGGFTRKATQTMTGTSLPVLMALVDKSLLRRDFEGRYQIHELLRQFGLDRLAKFPAAEAEARDRHCAYFAAFLKRQEADLFGHNQGKTLAEIEVEIDNVRVAWNWAVAQAKFDEIEQFMESLCEFYRIRGELDEGSETFYPAALTFGWQGFRTPEILPDSRQIFDETMHMLGSDASGRQNDDRTQDILGKVLARLSRFY